MKKKKNRYIAEAVKEMIKLRDLKPPKDVKGGFPPGPCGPGKLGSSRAGYDQN